VVVQEGSALLTLSQGTIPPGITGASLSAATSFHNRLNARVAFSGTCQQAPGFAEAVVHSVLTALGGIHVHGTPFVECLRRKDEPRILGKYVGRQKVDFSGSIRTQEAPRAVFVE